MTYGNFFQHRNTKKMTNMKNSVKFIIVILTLLITYSCNNHAPGDPTAENKNVKNIYAQTFPIADGWGYAIYVNGKLFIKQSFVPVIEGNKGFAKEADAKQVAALVVNKLNHHEKPTIQLDDLKQLELVGK